MKDNHAPTYPHSESLSFVGAKLGFVIALALSVIYAVLGVVVGESLGIGMGGTDNNRFFAPLLILCLGAPLIGLLAILPAVICGVVTGAIVGNIAENLNGSISERAFILLSAATCVLIAGLVHIVFRIPIDLTFESKSTSYLSLRLYETWPFLFGIPSVIYIIAGGWAGRKLYKRYLTRNNHGA